MSSTNILAFAGACALAVVLLAPLRSSVAYTTIGGSLAEFQRDVRVFDNFADATANDNATPSAQFPGERGAELAVWKAVVEWGSRLHGDGSGDPLGGNFLGSGGANFDAFWAGNASGIGGFGDNVVSTLATCGTGELAFTERPVGKDSWRIRFCDEWTWDDGPGSIGNRFDIQGTMAHEYGHALGLGHSSDPAATMFATTSAGVTATRSIEPDDVAGVRGIYGSATAGKPTISATVANPLSRKLTIHGMNFARKDNEVWFRSKVTTSPSSFPVLRVKKAASDGRQIVVTIPTNAAPGDVLVNAPGPGGRTLSNAFPTDLVGTFGSPPAGGGSSSRGTYRSSPVRPRRRSLTASSAGAGDDQETIPVLAAIEPQAVEALMPGPERAVTLRGSGFSAVAGILLDGVPVDARRYVVEHDSCIRIDLPRVATLGAHRLALTDGRQESELCFDVIEVSDSRLELAWTGSPATPRLRLVIGGEVGSLQQVLLAGGEPATVRVAGPYAVGDSGWVQVDLPPEALPAGLSPGGALFGWAVQLAPYPSLGSTARTLRMW